MSLEIFVIVFSCFVCHCFLLHYDFIISHFQSLVYIFLWCFMGGNSKVLLLRSEGNTIKYIADKLDINRNSVILCLNKYLDGGVENALFDAPRRGRNPEISDDEKSWIINIACQKT